MKPSKIIQIATGSYSDFMEWNDTVTQEHILYALDDQGIVWQKEFCKVKKTTKWVRVLIED